MTARKRIEDSWMRDIGPYFTPGAGWPRGLLRPRRDQLLNQRRRVFMNDWGAAGAAAAADAVGHVDRCAALLVLLVERSACRRQELHHRVEPGLGREVHRGAA